MTTTETFNFDAALQSELDSAALREAELARELDWAEWRAEDKAVAAGIANQAAKDARRSGSGWQSADTAAAAGIAKQAAKDARREAELVRASLQAAKVDCSLAACTARVRAREAAETR